jgi:AraC-like DNA-binding protein
VRRRLISPPASLHPPLHDRGLNPADGEPLAAAAGGHLRAQAVGEPAGERVAAPGCMGGQRAASANISMRSMNLLRMDHDGPRRRLDDFLANRPSPLDARIDARHDPRARILTGRVGPVDVTTVVNGPPHRAFRTRRLIRASDAEQFKIHVMVRGRAVWAQGDREAALSPGDFTLVDLSRTCQGADRDDVHEAVAVMFPHGTVPLHHDELARLTAVPISGQEGLGASISALARHLGGHLHGYGATDGARLATALMDLLVVALAERADRVAAIAPDTSRRALLARVQGFIEQRLGDPELSPGMVAAAHHVSLRYLHKLFETQDATVAAWIRRRRLERCRRDLLDPALGHWPVSAIAARWGLMDAAHFSRIFRAAYGQPPAQYRLTARLPGPR